MKDYYTKKKPPESGTYLRLAHWSLAAGIISLPCIIFPYLGIVVGAIAITLAVLSVYNGDGYRASSAKVGLILGIITLFISFIIVYINIYILNHIDEFNDLYRSVTSMSI